MPVVKWWRNGSMVKSFFSEMSFLDLLTSFFDIKPAKLITNAVAVLGPKIAI